MQLEVRTSLAAIEPAAWDRLVGDGSPFLEWAWLASLEEAGCVCTETGWLPQHLTLWEGERLVGACPLYLKSHSQGEFVFDHGWAEAAARAAIPYYPKILVAVPFTPVSGTRFLVHPQADPDHLRRLLGSALRDLCDRYCLSSVHVNFCLPEEAAVLAGLGFEGRTGYQFHWTNRGWDSFDDYLSALRSKRRNQIKRERRELGRQGIAWHVHSGDDIPDTLFGPLFDLYRSTVEKFYWGRQYLNRDFFDLLRRRWKHRLAFFVARRDERIVAGTFTVRKGDALYGRYWGAFEEWRYLHFNLCYYASIDYCLRAGVTRFEPGAGGEFKHWRGFDAQPTRSMHYVRDPRLADAIRRHLASERRAIDEEVRWFDAHGARRQR